MLTDDQMDRRLRARLAAEVADIQAAPGLGAAVRRQYHRRAVATRVSLTAAPIAAAMAMTLVATAGAGGQHAPSTAASSAVTMHDVAYLQEHAATALAHISDYVIRESGAHDASYRDMTTNRTRWDHYDADGRQIESMADVSLPTYGSDVLVVDYPHRTWWLLKTYKGMGSGPAAPLQDPDSIRDALAKGTWRLVGPERVNGHDTLHLRRTNPVSQSASISDLWVGAQNYLPYRWQVDSLHGGDTLRVDIEWLPRTAANLARLPLTPPAGFTQLPTRPAE